MRATPRVALLGFSHESNTFAPEPTTWSDLESHLLVGSAVRTAESASSSTMAGFLGAKARAGIAAVPLLSCQAVPGGTLTQDAFERMSDAIMDALRGTGPWDALLLALHGAAAAEHLDDPDGELLARIRVTVGAGMPVGVVLDMHANLSEQMVRNSTALLTYRTNPHLDAFDRGVECAGLIARTLRGEIQPVQVLESPPAAISILRQGTSSEPVRSILQDLNEVLRQPGVLSASFAQGYPYADVPKMGIGIVVAHDGSAVDAERHARWLGERAWARREQFAGGGVSVEEAVDRAARAPDGPVVLLDAGDNIGGGAPGDCVAILRAAINLGVESVVVVVWDPAAAELCKRAGVGAQIELSIGGRYPGHSGEPVAVRGVVRALSDGRFEERGPTHGGARHFDAGASAAVEVDGHRTVVLMSKRIMPVSLGQLTHLGIDPLRYQVIVAKGVESPKPAYGPIARELIPVESPGVTAADLRTLRYRHRRRPMFPFEPDAAYPTA